MLLGLPCLTLRLLFLRLRCKGAHSAHLGSDLRQALLSVDGVELLQIFEHDGLAFAELVTGGLWVLAFVLDRGRVGLDAAALLFENAHIRIILEESKSAGAELSTGAFHGTSALVTSFLAESVRSLIIKFDLRRGLSLEHDCGDRVQGQDSEEEVGETQV